MRNYTKEVLVGDAADDLDGQQLDTNQIVAASFHAYFSDSTAEGDFKLQASNDVNNANYLSGVSGFEVQNWVDIPNQAVAVVNGLPALLTLPVLPYKWIRAIWRDDTSGMSTATVVINSNTLGM